MSLNAWFGIRADRMDRITQQIFGRGKNDIPERGVERIDTGLKTQTSESSYPSQRPTLIPLESPWRDGQRYRLAAAIEWPSRLDLYLEDDAGPWIRRHGVLIAISR